METLLNLLGEGIRIWFSSLENHVAALNVGFHVVEAKLCKHAAEVFHFYQLLAADVDSTQECYVLGHFSPLRFVSGKIAVRSYIKRQKRWLALHEGKPNTNW